MFQAKVNNRFEWMIEFKNNAVFINEHETAFDVLKIKEGSFHVLHQQKSFSAEVIEINKQEKTAIIRVNNNEYTVALKDKFDLLLQQMGMANLAIQKVNDLKAPMPGKVLSIMANVGDMIKKGEPILILEAMKMENILKATADAVVKEIKVKQGDTVEKNAVLVVMG
jgi:biotin carboxyl carrier protein